MKITIQNTFHRTECSIITGPDGIANRRQLARVKKVLCGQAECRCGWNGVTDNAGNKRETEYLEDGRVQFPRV